MKKSIKLLVPIFTILLLSSCGSITDAPASVDDGQEIESVAPNQFQSSQGWGDQGYVTPSK